MLAPIICMNFREFLDSGLDRVRVVTARMWRSTGESSSLAFLSLGGIVQINSRIVG